MSRSLLAACLLAASHAWVAPFATHRSSALAAKASGVPEYRVYVTPTGTEQWTPIGCVTVPRTESVSQSIFGNEESLLQVARQAGVKGDELDYGYNRAIFPDDPVTPADRAEALRSTNPLQRFAKDLTNPLGFGGK